jgi:hypothetical protein
MRAVTYNTSRSLQAPTEHFDYEIRTLPAFKIYQETIGIEIRARNGADVWSIKQVAESSMGEKKKRERLSADSKDAVHRRRGNRR